MTFTGISYTCSHWPYHCNLWHTVFLQAPATHINHNLPIHIRFMTNYVGVRSLLRHCTSSHEVKVNFHTQCTNVYNEVCSDLFNLLCRMLIYKKVPLLLYTNNGYVPALFRVTVNFVYTKMVLQVLDHQGVNY